MKYGFNQPRGSQLSEADVGVTQVGRFRGQMSALRSEIQVMLCKVHDGKKIVRMSVFASTS